jgi:hypothetical protein
MSEQKLSFAERMAARKAAVDSGTAVAGPSLAPAEAPANEPAPQSKPSGFGFKKAATSTSPEPVPSGGGGFKSRFSTPASATASSPAPTEASAPAEEAVAKSEEGTKPLPKVIQAFNVAGATKPAAATLGQDLSGLPPEEYVKQIQQKIEDMQQVEGAALKYEMEALSKMLTDHPAACLYLLDEDLGKAVRALRRMTDNRVAVDMGRAKPRGGSAKAPALSTKMTAEDMAAAMAEL